MRFRKLRIAWSVGWGLLGALLAVLWARSFYAHDDFQVTMIAPNRIEMISWRGSIHVLKMAPPGRNVAQAWRWHTMSTEEWLRLRETAAGWGRLIPEPSLSFRLGPAPNLWHLWVPHWLCAAFASALAALPWLRWRFSVRTLLIATTLVAVVLGLIVWLSRGYVKFGRTGCPQELRRWGGATLDTSDFSGP